MLLLTFFSFISQRHGAFVWDQFSKDHAERLLNYYGSPVSGDNSNTKNVVGSKNNNYLKNHGDLCEGENAEFLKDSGSTEQAATILPPICT